MQKAMMEKRKQKLYLEYLIKEKNKIIGRSQIKKLHENLVITKQKATSKTEKLQLKNNAAIKIQRVVRGWLTRKKHENEFISISRQLVNLNINEIDAYIPQVLLFGRNCFTAATMIQKAYRRFKILKKIARFKKIYDLTIKNNVKAQAKRFLRRTFKVIIAKKKISDRKHEISAKIGMARIRKNLALIVIRRYWKKHLIHVADLTKRLRNSNLARLGININESSHESPHVVTNKKPIYKSNSRIQFKVYYPILSQRNSRVLVPTQASNSRARIRLTPSRSFHKRTFSDFSLYNKPTRPSTPYK